MAGWEREVADLVARSGRVWANYAYLLCGDPVEAEDLVQEALVRTFARRGPAGSPERSPERGGRVLHDLDNAEAYVHRAILSCHLDGYRRRQRWSRVRHLWAPEARRDVPDHQHDGAARVDLAAALAALAPRQRACVVLRFYDDLTVPQIARELGIADGTVKRQLSDALRRLEGWLGPIDREPIPREPGPLGEQHAVARPTVRTTGAER